MTVGDLVTNGGAVMIDAEAGDVAIAGTKFAPSTPQTVEIPWSTRSPMSPFGMEPARQCPEPAQFRCVENCIPDDLVNCGGPSTAFTRPVWSFDGVSEPPAGEGLEPGRQPMQLRNGNLDTDGMLLTFLGGFALGQATEGAAAVAALSMLVRRRVS